jgi:hypothetical protein
MRSLARVTRAIARHALLGKTHLRLHSRHCLRQEMHVARLEDALALGREKFPMRKKTIPTHRRSSGR